MYAAVVGRRLIEHHPPPAPKCIYEHLPPRRPPDGPFAVVFLSIHPVHIGGTLAAAVAAVMILAVLLVLIVTILLFFFYFSRNKSTSSRDDVVSEEIEKSVENEEVVNKRIFTNELETRRDTMEDENEWLEAAETSEVVDSAPEVPEDPVDLVVERLVGGSVAPEPLPSPEGSPKSTSSCVSSSIFTETSRPCSLPCSSLTSEASCTPPTFEFSRKTPELVPRMMTEEFESLDKSIERRKLDIRDLLRRIESTKRQHRRFSEHLQRVQHEHLIDY